MSYFIKTCHRCGHENLLFAGDSNQELTCASCNKAFHYLKITNIKGFVYILSNETMPGLLKIGYSERPVQERVAELNRATAVPSPFLIEAYFGFAEPQTAENLIHQRLSQYRLNNKEFFKIEVDRAVEIISQSTSGKLFYFRDKNIRQISIKGLTFNEFEVANSPTLQWLISKNR